MLFQSLHLPVDTGRKLNVHKTFRKGLGRLLNVLCTSCVYWAGFHKDCVPFCYRVVNIIKKEIQLARKKKSEIKRFSLKNKCDRGGLENADKFYEIISLQCFWASRLFDKYFCDWKMIPSFSIKKNFGENLIFHSNADISKCPINNFSRLYKEVLFRVVNIYPYLSAYLQQLLLSFCD